MPVRRFAPWRPWDLVDAYRAILAAIPMGRQCVGHVRQVLASTQHKGPDEAFRVMTLGAAGLPQQRRDLVVLAALYVLDHDMGYENSPRYPPELVDASIRTPKSARPGGKRVDIWRDYLIACGGRTMLQWRIWRVKTGCTHGCISVDVMGVPDAPGLYVVAYHSPGVPVDVCILGLDGYVHPVMCDHMTPESGVRRLGAHQIIDEVNRRATGAR